MKELLHDTDSVLIAAVSFVSMALAIEIGLRVGRLRSLPTHEAAKEYINGTRSTTATASATRRSSATCRSWC